MTMTMRRRGRLACWSSLIVLGAAPLWAQSGGRWRGLEQQIRISGLFLGNFLQAPEGAPEVDVKGISVEGRLTTHLGRKGRLTAYVEGGYTAYQDFDASSSLETGLRQRGQPGSFQLALRVLRNRPSRDIGDEFDRANSVGLRGRYSYRFLDNYEASALLDFRKETFDLSPDKENDFTTAGVALRYRGFGWQFSPEVGFRKGSRDVVSDNEDISQREIFVKLRWAPNKTTYVTARYRRRKREYTIELPAARNLGREDTRTQWTLIATWRRSQRLIFDLYYAVENADSTHPSGIFDKQSLAAGATLRF